MLQLHRQPDITQPPLPRSASHVSPPREHPHSKPPTPGPASILHHAPFPTMRKKYERPRCPADNNQNRICRVRQIPSSSNRVVEHLVDRVHQVEAVSLHLPLREQRRRMVLAVGVFQ
jgi:hypothetical protein